MSGEDASAKAKRPILVNLDGRIVPPEEATVSIFDRSFLFGDSVYETLRTYDKKPFALDRHLARLRGTLAGLRLRIFADDAEITRRILDTIAATGNAECYVRVVVSRGVGAFGLQAGIDSPGVVYVIVRPFEPLSEEAYVRGISVVLAKTRRNHRTALDPALKTGNYLNNLLAMIEAKDAGADDALLLNHEGFLTEATTSNVFLVIGGTLVTPPLSAGILEGVTRHFALDAARAAGLPVEERDVTVAELRAADEIFVTSTLKEVLPVRTLDGVATRVPAPGPITTRMRAILAARILS